ncbi:hypothetical protein V4C85_25700 [Ralstonia solanacearum]|uniref:hypothetical protein n=1 Tax=Ralstonia solanacearum TaxID=305 RepID=UPI000AEA03C3|nr:hypothetical protein [Ralstonia solanacearum]
MVVTKAHRILASLNGRVQYISLATRQERSDFMVASGFLGLGPLLQLDGHCSRHTVGTVPTQQTINPR